MSDYDAVVIGSGSGGLTAALARAERYVLIEAGHAAQNVYLQAEALGLEP